jgi:leucyl aminopeptidase
LTEKLCVQTGNQAVTDIDTDVLIVPVIAKDELNGTAVELNSRLDGLVGEMRSRREFRADANEVAVIPTFGRIAAGRVLLVGLGKERDCTLDTCRLAMATAARSAGKRGLFRAVADASDFPAQEGLAAALAEGAELSRYVPDPYRTAERRDSRLRELHVASAPADEVREGEIRGRAKNTARALVNEPSNRLDPEDLAARAEAMAAETGLECRVLDAAAMEQLGMGAILTVSRGSEFPPRFIVLSHKKGGDGPLLALVGKAVCFDTGGISIKPTADMGRMKGDMAGGAAVFGAMQAIAELDVPANVIGLIPAVINMPDGRAWKPGDVVTAKSGKTIETITTDAEGRMLLADGVAYARELGADYVVDIATLTGACVVALGHVASGLFGTNEDLIRAVRECGEAAGEKHWPMPLFREYRELIRSEIADLKNSGGRAGGAITAAWFIREFAGDTPWVHLDIAGSGSYEKPRPWAPTGPTGTGVGTFINLAMRMGRSTGG